jgi:hypothetical protein
MTSNPAADGPGATVERRSSKITVAVGAGAPLNDLDQAYRLSQALALASVLPNSLRGKPSDVLAIMLYGCDLGLSPMQSIMGIYVVKGKPQLAAITWIAKAKEAGHKIRWGHRDRESATVTIIPAGDPDNPITETFTIEDAEIAGLGQIRDGVFTARSSNGERLPWETYTRQMLQWRALTGCAKLACPEVAFGYGIFIEGDRGEKIPVEETTDGDDAAGGDGIEDAEVVPGPAAQPEPDPETVAAEVGDLASQFNFATGTERPGPPADYVCTTCGEVGGHYEDDHAEPAGGPVAEGPG